MPLGAFTLKLAFYVPHWTLPHPQAYVVVQLPSGATACLIVLSQYGIVQSNLA